MQSRPTEGSIESESNQDDADLSEEAKSQPQRKRKTKQSDYDEQVLKALQSNEDDDTNYCLSLVPFMKELTSDEKLEVRIRILQIFQDTKKKRLLPNTMYNIQPSTSQFSRSSRPPKRVAPSTSIRIIADEIIQPKPVQSTNQAIFSQHMKDLQQQYITEPQETVPSFLQLSSPSAESQTPPPQCSTPSPHDSTISSYWTKFSE
ncbi:unnamed protein product [Acanthoscelides obtectus]|uniref:BESS domain-containing protein n=1 Tax=Acanthoscelides obtectus TaxID=200917 RepID=A0A9P0M6Z6_ACAOB|nr:unnamed protein product [Acanthoscelides obtectus]CAK1627283.1 hypothetical protein AOBTE_LOCUS4479 [Acanthoscelides obtectus]